MLHCDQTCKRIPVPLARWLLGERRKHCHEDGTADRGRRIAGNGPCCDFGLQRCPFNGPVLSEVIGRQHAASFAHVRRHCHTQFSLIEDACTVFSYGRQAVSKMRYDDGGALLPQRAVRVVQCVIAVIAAPKYALARIAEVVMTGG